MWSLLAAELGVIRSDAISELRSLSVVERSLTTANMCTL